MSASAILFMSVTWLLVIGLSVFCLSANGERRR